LKENIPTRLKKEDSERAKRGRCLKKKERKKKEKEGKKSVDD
jgi:hypothetical protein